MRFDIHLHLHQPRSNEVPPCADDIHDKLDLILERLGDLMPTLADIQATLTVIDGKLATVKTDVDALLAKVAAIPTGGLTPEQQAAIDDIAQHVQGIATSLGAIDAEVNPPTV